MQNLIKTAVLLALLGSRIAIAQTLGKSPAGRAAPIVTSSLAQDPRSVGGASIGHRQPHAADVASEAAGRLEQLSAEDASVDRKLNICRGC
jgi:RNA 3'-terminal phosphate cyclase